jgi:hypothetical protein
MALSAARGSRQPAAPGTVTPHVAMSWAQRLKRVFGIDIETCERCGGAVKTQTRTTMTCAAAEMRAPNMRAICTRNSHNCCAISGTALISEIDPRNPSTWQSRPEMSIK